MRRPVILRGVDIGPAPHKWTPQYLIQHAPPQTVSVHVCEDNKLDFARKNFVYKSLPLAEFIARASGHLADYVPRPVAALGDATTEAEPRPAAQELPPYLVSPHETYYLRSLGDNVRKDVADFASQYPSLSGDLRLPLEFLPPSAAGRPYFSSVLRISSPGSRLWTHYDIPDNFLIHVTGRKRVVLFPPSDAPFLYLQSSSSYITDIDHPDLHLYPKFQHAHPIQCQLEPGDILFLPALWFHHVVATDFSVSVNVFWHHLEEEMYDSRDLYGNRDLVMGQTAMEAADAARQALAGLPPYYADFYRLRATEIINS
eukprot:TRINITY_DN7628_c0_g1_i2.p1 TRINITY_DN7628_c0_g1~~TRINITY_DN7628_c0_g1_i2.p1  ORF type:complete len:314 (+),score=46.33 TRINITY_DN7628_c0_g1_i2:81-1022(+)